jgi:cytochrome oxidase Cu insertion factor (SCO1/SenC/PrrC family)
LVGAGALGASEEVIAVADKLSAGCAKALLGKAVLPDDLPWVTGSIGLLGTEPSYKLMTECDTLLMVGSAFPYSEFLPKEGGAHGVQIDSDASMLSIRFPMQVGLVGDAAETLRALLPRLRLKPAGDWRKTIETSVGDWWKTLEDRARQPAEPINPQRVTWELSPRLPDRTIITSDSGSCANWFARDRKMRRGMKASLSGGLASMGAAVPYAIAAKYADPDRPVIALVGDGAMQMNNMAELITVAKYWRRWQDHRWIVCVFNNEDLNQVTWEQRIINGDPKFEASQRIPNVSYSRFAEMIGLRGIYVDDPDLVGSAGIRRSPAMCRWSWKSRPTRKCLRCRRTSRFSRRRTSRSRSPKAIPTRSGSFAVQRGRCWRPSCPARIRNVMARGARVSIRRLAAALLIVLAVPCFARAELIGAKLDKVEAAPEQNAQLPLQLKLEDEAGEIKLLQQWLGDKPTVWVLADYTCTTLCGSVVSTVSDVLRQTGLKPGTDFRFIVIGFDPKDSTEDARAMKDAQVGTDGELPVHTHFLRGGTKGVTALAAAFGFRSVYDEEHDQYAHPAAAFVVTQAGRVARALPGLGLDTANLRLALVEASLGRIGNFTDHIRLMCYGFDPASGVYTAMVGRLLASVSALTIIGLVLLIAILFRRERTVQRG